MAIARIITPSPHEVQSLADQLRGRGYTVEIVARDEVGVSTAELEISAETCAVEPALPCAAEQAQAADADVFVAPGICRAIEASKPSLSQPEQEMPAVNAVRAETASPAGVDHVVEAVELPQPGSDIDAVEDIAPALAQPLASVEPSLESPPARHDTPPAVNRTKPVREALAAFAGAVGDLGEKVDGSVAENVHRLSARMTAWRAARLDVRERRRAERRQAPAVKAAVVQRAIRPVPPLRPKPLPQIANYRTPSREREWKLAAMFSAAVAVAVMLAWMLASHRPSPPLPADMLMRSNSIQQKVPFGPVTLRAPMAVNTQPVTPIAAKVPGVQHSPSPVHAQPSVQDDEVVVRHFTRSTPVSRTTESRNGVKRFSDLE